MFVMLGSVILGPSGTVNCIGEEQGVAVVRHITESFSAEAVHPRPARPCAGGRGYAVSPHKRAGNSPKDLVPYGA